MRDVILSRVDPDRPEEDAASLSDRLSLRVSVILPPVVEDVIAHSVAHVVLTAARLAQVRGISRGTWPANDRQRPSSLQLASRPDALAQVLDVVRRVRSFCKDNVTLPWHSLHTYSFCLLSCKECSVVSSIALTIRLLISQTLSQKRGGIIRSNRGASPRFL